MSDIATDRKTYDYPSYRSLIQDLREQGLATGGLSSDDFLKYTDLNINRMDKWDKRYELSADLKEALDALDHQEDWVVLTEGWCGDAAHALPVIAKAAEYSDKVELKILLRDENVDLMDQHLTNGGRSIPKLIRYNLETGDEMGSWGPRPKPAQQLMIDAKVAGKPKADINLDLQKWYARDRGVTMDREITELLKN